MVQMVSVPPVSVPLVPVPPPMSMPQVSVAELLDLVPTCSVNSIPLSSQTQFPDALEADSATEMVLTDGQKRLLDGQKAAKQQGHEQKRKKLVRARPHKAG